MNAQLQLFFFFTFLHSCCTVQIIIDRCNPTLTWHKLTPRGCDDTTDSTRLYGVMVVCICSHQFIQRCIFKKAQKPHSICTSRWILLAHTHSNCQHKSKSNISLFLSSVNQARQAPSHGVVNRHGHRRPTSTGQPGNMAKLHNFTFCVYSGGRMKQGRQ